MQQDDEGPRYRRQRVAAEWNSADDLRGESRETRSDPSYVELDKKELDRAHKIQEENWIRSYWRPGMGWLYMLICFADFVFFPLLAMVIPAILKNFGVENATYVPWTSLTLSNGGMIHLAFGAILGVTAWTRGLEKLRTHRGDN